MLIVQSLFTLSTAQQCQNSVGVLSSCDTKTSQGCICVGSKSQGKLVLACLLSQLSHIKPAFQSRLFIKPQHWSQFIETASSGFQVSHVGMSASFPTTSKLAQDSSAL